MGVTANHPFWSVDRAEFVQAGELTIGERLQTLAGDTLWVQQKLPRPGPEPVYNLEVHDEHVYYVGTSGILAHNAGKKYTGDIGEDGAKGWLARHGYTEVRSIQNRSGHGLDIIAKHRDGTLTFFEVKTSSLLRAPSLSDAQRKFFNFITSRLGRAANRMKWWGKTPQSVVDDADQLHDFVTHGGKFRRYVIEITGAGNPNLPTQFRILPWLQ
ncbi:MAG: polymorphic toxin-type HINT domain-containing protein [Pirellulaceae bacterium]|nr:polymorphic toxin-type HINT domain-containing protein [Pirellulaceae bacterium]